MNFSSTSINNTPPLTQTQKDVGTDPKKSNSKSPDVTKPIDSKIPWKANVVEMPVAMGPEYIIENHREHREGGFYYDHRIIIPEMPEEYSVKPFETRKTGGNHPDTGKTGVYSIEISMMISFFLLRSKRISTSRWWFKENLVMG